MPNISFQSLGITTESKIFCFGCKSDTAVSTLTFCFLFYCFSCLMKFFCLFAGRLLGFILAENAFGKAFRFFDGRKGSYTVLTFFLRTPWFNLAHSGIIKLKGLLNLHKLDDNIVLDCSSFAYFFFTRFGNSRPDLVGLFSKVEVPENCYFP